MNDRDCNDSGVPTTFEREEVPVGSLIAPGLYETVSVTQVDPFVPEVYLFGGTMSDLGQPMDSPGLLVSTESIRLDLSEEAPAVGTWQIDNVWGFTDEDDDGNNDSISHGIIPRDPPKIELDWLVPFNWGKIHTDGDLLDPVVNNNNPGLVPPPCQDLGEISAPGLVDRIDGFVEINVQNSWDGNDTDTYCFTTGVESIASYSLDWADDGSDLDIYLIGSFQGGWYYWDNRNGVDLSRPEADTSTGPLLPGETYVFWVVGYSGNSTDYRLSFWLLGDEDGDE
jgi:hypothetical protein